MMCVKLGFQIFGSTVNIPCLHIAYQRNENTTCLSNFSCKHLYNEYPISDTTSYLYGTSRLASLVMMLPASPMVATSPMSMVATSPMSMAVTSPQSMAATPPRTMPLLSVASLSASFHTDSTLGGTAPDAGGPARSVPASPLVTQCTLRNLLEAKSSRLQFFDRTRFRKVQCCKVSFDN